MYILGSMIRLDSDEHRVPVPWWHRAPLGFETGTQVKVSVTEPQGGRPGDLLVSVLDPNCWDQHISVRCLSDDRPGVIEGVFEVVSDWNIALAETVTVEGGKQHRVELICEPYRRSGAILTKDKTDELIEKLQSQFQDVQVRSFPALNTGIAWSRFGTIKNGWVTFSSYQGAVTWKDVISKQLKELSCEDDFDIQKLVLSADTTGRLFRGMFPRMGAVTVHIEHADEPGVLRQLGEALRQAGVNVLSGLLKRGGADPNNAILVAVCEPADPAVGRPINDKITDTLGRLPQELRPAWRIEEGLKPRAVIYVRHPDDVVAHVPDHLWPRVVDRRDNFAAGKLPVFLSRRFFPQERPRQYALKLRDVLREADCETVEAGVLPGGTQTSLDEVSAAMWAARAGIVLGVEAENESDVAFSLNLAHEFGFLQGQGKPLLLLIESPSRVERELDTWSNIKGITAPRFSREYALSDAHVGSIRAVVERWLAEIKQSGP